MKRVLLTIVVSWVCLISAKAQQTAGTSGLLNTPSADFNPDGTFSLGINYLPETVTPDWFDYPTGNFFLNITYFSFLELTFRTTLQRVPQNGNKMSNQDRSLSLRLRALKESYYLPAVVIGSNDILTSKFSTIINNDRKDNQFFGSVYGVATKNLSISDNTVGLTFGYEYATDRMSQFTGILAGIRFSPAFYTPLSLIVEYDADNMNIGTSVLLFKHIYLQVFTSEFKNISAGIAYRGQLH
ncbi:MAG: YjbH domain-containing protein [Dysgonamonadaceae bacterium]|jgi:hypothetical protein|nr:YjbH domain-containing protein [Dysgonamonadaceae bacterium]